VNGTDLPSWNDTATRRAIVAFVDAAVDEGGPGFVPPHERVAVFDDDGTLWCEKPTPVQLGFVLGLLARAAERDPSLRSRQPWSAARDHDHSWLGQAMVDHDRGDDGRLQQLVGAIEESLGGMSVDAYEDEIDHFLAGARHPTLDRPLLACGYQPMVELLRSLEAHGFTTYIASGGDPDFMRAVAGPLFGIPRERVIGSSFALEYRDDAAAGPVLTKDALDLLDDGPRKPVSIWSRVGRRPVLAAGNADDDVPMLRFTGAHGHPGLRLLVRHDDPDREFAYTAGAGDALARAGGEGWTVVSMKDDWATVFADEPPPAGSAPGTAPPG
jgi:haloacid dehalogenase-like hydrolase